MLNLKCIPLSTPLCFEIPNATTNIQQPLVNQGPPATKRKDCETIVCRRSDCVVEARK